MCKIKVNHILWVKIGNNVKFFPPHPQRWSFWAIHIFICCMRKCRCSDQVLQIYILHKEVKMEHLCYFGRFTFAQTCVVALQLWWWQHQSPGYTCVDKTDIQQPFIQKETPGSCGGNGALIHCQSSSPPTPPLLSCLSLSLWCVHVCICAEQGLIKGLSVALLLLFSQTASLCLCGGETLWWSPLAVEPLLYSPSHHHPPPAPPSPSPLSFPPRLSPHHHLPTPHLLPPFTPSQALGRKRTASALQTQGQKLPVGSHGNSFSLTLSPLPRSVKGSVENRRAPLFFSTLSHSPN